MPAAVNTTCATATAISRTVAWRFRTRGPRTGEENPLLVQVILMRSAFIGVLTMPIKLFTAEISFDNLLQNGVAYIFRIIGNYLKIFIFY
jgi:hypothetical protein